MELQNQRREIQKDLDVVEERWTSRRAATKKMVRVLLLAEASAHW